jgi:hypothetical protein
VSGGDCQAKIKIGVKRLLTLPSRQQTSGCHLRHIQLTCTFLSYLRTYLTLASHFTPYESRSSSTPSRSPRVLRLGYFQVRDCTNTNHLPHFDQIPDAGTSTKLLKAYQVISLNSPQFSALLHCHQPQTTTRPVDALATWFGPDNQDGNFKHLQC